MNSEKTKESSRLKRTTSHFSFENQEYFGCKLSWVHILFSLTALKFNMRYQETNKFDISQILLIEFWLEKAMNTFDEVGSKNLIGFIEDGLYGANKHIYLYMRSINMDYFLLGGGKVAFRKLPNLLRKGVFHTIEYKTYEKFLQEESERLNCEITDLEINDDNIDYEKIKW